MKGVDYERQFQNLPYQDVRYEYTELVDDGSYHGIRVAMVEHPTGEAQAVVEFLEKHGESVRKKRMAICTAVHLAHNIKESEMWPIAMNGHPDTGANG